MPDRDPTSPEVMLGVGNSTLKVAERAVAEQSIGYMLAAMPGVVALLQASILRQAVLQKLLAISDEEMAKEVKELASDERFAPDLQELIAFHNGQSSVKLRSLANPNPRQTGEVNSGDPSGQPVLPPTPGP